MWDLKDVLSGRVPRRTSDQQTSFFKTTPFGEVGDQVIGALLYQRALEKGIDTKLQIDGAEYREV